MGPSQKSRVEELERVRAEKVDLGAGR